MATGEKEQSSQSIKYPTLLINVLDPALHFDCYPHRVTPIQRLEIQQGGQDSQGELSKKHPICTCFIQTTPSVVSVMYIPIGEDRDSDSIFGSPVDTPIFFPSFSSLVLTWTARKETSILQHSSILDCVF